MTATANTIREARTAIRNGTAPVYLVGGKGEVCRVFGLRVKAGEFQVKLTGGWVAPNRHWTLEVRS